MPNRWSSILAGVLVSVGLFLLLWSGYRGLHAMWLSATPAWETAADAIQRQLRSSYISAAISIVLVASGLGWLLRTRRHTQA